MNAPRRINTIIQVFLNLTTYMINKYHYTNFSKSYNIHDQNLDGFGKWSTSTVLGYYTYFSVYNVISFIIYHTEITLQTSNKKKFLENMCPPKRSTPFQCCFWYIRQEYKSINQFWNLKHYTTGDKKCSKKEHFITFISSPTILMAGALRKVWWTEPITWKGKKRNALPILWNIPLESVHYKNLRGERIILNYITGTFAQGLWTVLDSQSITSVVERQWTQYSVVTYLATQSETKNIFIKLQKSLKFSWRLWYVRFNW